MTSHLSDVAPVRRRPVDLTSAALTQMYRAMYLSRKIDDRQIQLKQQQKTFFQLSGAGHEAVLVAVGAALKSGYDWFFPYYRDQALCVMLGAKTKDILLEAVGGREAPYSGGRQMPSHWGMKELHVVSRSSPTGMQFLHALGCAEATRYASTRAGSVRRDGAVFHGDEITCVLSGEGATSEGEFWEAMCAASLRRLPVLFVIEDNGYAISVPVEVETPGGNVSKLVESFPNLLVKSCDGTDPLESYAVVSEAAAHCRAGRGPALVHAKVVRLNPHSNSDDDRLYRTDDERRAERKHDPLPKFRRHLIEEGVASDQTLSDLEEEVTREISEAVQFALAADAPDVHAVTDHVYSPDVDPTADTFASEPASQGDPKTMVDLINLCLRDEMASDDRIVVFGEDIADVSREQLLDVVKGKGGVFKATAGLQRKFGGDRVWNSPIAEAAIVGRAVGMAIRGLKPVVEIQFFDYIWPAMMQIRNELANMRWRSKSNFKCPLVIRAPIGGYLNGGGPYHSQSGEVTFAHIPGLRVVMPSNALDANGLLRTAIRCDDPVLFLEPKHLYRQLHNRAPYPGPDYMVPFGKAAVARAGEDLTIITYGSTVIRSVHAADTLAQQDGVSVEVVDLRSLNPYDWTAIERSVQKTNRVLVVHEDWASWGYGAEIAARIADELFEHLDAPVRRVAALDVFCAYNPVLEHEILPQTADIVDACRALARF